MPEADADELLHRWQDDGDRDALDQLLRIEMSSLKGMIRGRNPELLKQSLGATDAAQEAVLALLRVQTAPHFDNPRALRGYLWKAAWRLLRQRLERRGKRPLRLDGTQSSGFEQDALAATGGMGKVEENDRSVALDVAVNLLTPAERTILDLVYFKHLDIGTAAERLGVTKDAANMRLVRARRALADKLADWDELIG